MLQSPSTPLWLELTKAFGGPVIAAAVVIAGLIWRDRIERRNAAQEWFEQTYVTNGIDVLIAHLSAMQSSCTATRDFLPKSPVPTLPPEIPGRLRIVVPSSEFFFAYYFMETAVLFASRNEHPVLLGPTELNELYFFAGHLLGYAQKIRLALLSMTVRTKTDIYRLSHFLVGTVTRAEKDFQDGETLFAVHRRLVDKYADLGSSAAIKTMTEEEKEIWRQSANVPSDTSKGNA